MDAIPSSSSWSTQVYSALTACRKVAVDTCGKALGPAGAGITLRVVGLVSLAWPFFGVAAGMLSTRLVIKLNREYNPSLVPVLNELSEKATAFFTKHPWVRVISLLFAAIIASYAAVVAFGAGAALGVGSALTIDGDTIAKQQVVDDAKSRGDGMGDIINQWV